MNAKWEPPSWKKRYDDLFADFCDYVAVESYLIGAGFVTREDLAKAHDAVRKNRTTKTDALEDAWNQAIK